MRLTREEKTNYSPEYRYKETDFMKKMKAQVVESPDNMVYKDVPIPQIGTDEVLVKVKYCGICGSDWSIYKGYYAAEKLPLITGHEFWGTIEEMGENVTGLKIGDRVAVDLCLCCGTCYFCRRGDGLLCQTFTQLGIHTDGGFAEYVKAPADNCYIIPDEIDDYAATFIEPLTTAIEASKRMDCELGSSVVVIGCGLGIIHASMAKLRGATPVIIVGDNPDRLAVAAKMGIDYCVDINKTPDAVAEVMKLTNGIGADYVIEAVGTPKTYEQALPCCGAAERSRHSAYAHRAMQPRCLHMSLCLVKRKFQAHAPASDSTGASLLTCSSIKGSIHPVCIR